MLAMELLSPPPLCVKADFDETCEVHDQCSSRDLAEPFTYIPARPGVWALWIDDDEAVLVRELSVFRVCVVSLCRSAAVVNGNNDSRLRGERARNVGVHQGIRRIGAEVGDLRVGTRTLLQGWGSNNEGGQEGRRGDELAKELHSGEGTRRG